MGRRATSPEEHARGARLAAELRDARSRRAWSQEHLARRADLSVETVRALERRSTPHPAFFTIVQLAEALGVELDDLVRKARR